MQTMRKMGLNLNLKEFFYTSHLRDLAQIALCHYIVSSVHASKVPRRKKNMWQLIYTDAMWIE